MDHDHVETGAGLDLAGVCVVARDTRNTSGGQRGAPLPPPRAAVDAMVPSEDLHMIKREQHRDSGTGQSRDSDTGTEPG